MRFTLSPGIHVWGFLMLVVVGHINALDAPKDLVAVAQEQHRWLTSIGGLRVHYLSRIESCCPMSEAMKPPPKLFWLVDSETWYDRQLAGYRQETRLNHEAFAKDVREAAKREPRLTPKLFPRFNVDSILVVTRERSAYLESDSGRLLLRKAVPNSEASGLETGINVQPLLYPLWLHTLEPGGISSYGPEFLNPMVGKPTLEGIDMVVNKTFAPGLLQWQIEATVIQDKSPLNVVLRLGCLGPATGPQFWFVTSLESEGFKATVRWRELPGAPFVAVMESYTVQSADAPKVEVHKLVSAELIADPAPSLWTIDPLLAAQIIDETAGMAVDAAP